MLLLQICRCRSDRHSDILVFKFLIFSPSYRFSDSFSWRFSGATYVEVSRLLFDLPSFLAARHHLYGFPRTQRGGARRCPTTFCRAELMTWAEWCIFASAKLERLVLGSNKADFCNHILVQYFSRATIFSHFCTAPNSNS